MEEFFAWAVTGGTGVNGLNKYQTEKYVSFKSNNINLFKKKWRIFEELFLSNT